MLRSGIAAINAIIAPTWSISPSTNPNGALGAHSSTAVPVTTICGRGTHIAEPDITLDVLSCPQPGFAEAAAGGFETNYITFAYRKLNPDELMVQRSSNWACMDAS